MAQYNIGGKAKSTAKSCFTQNNNGRQLADGDGDLQQDCLDRDKGKGQQISLPALSF